MDSARGPRRLLDLTGASITLLAALACDPQPGDTNGGAATSGQAMLEPPEPAGLRPRWVLLDKDGQAVKALIEPHCGDPEDCRLPDIGGPPEFPCVHVIMHEDRYVGMLFGLNDGSPLSCHHQVFPGPIMSCSTKPDCSAPYFRGAPEEVGPDRPDAVRTIYRDGDQLLYVSSSEEPLMQDCFFRDPVDGCMKSVLDLPVFPILPVPEEFMGLLADGAPYTLAVAYE